MKARIGIDLGGTKIEGIRLEADGAVSERLRVDTPKDDYEATVSSIVQMALALDRGESLKVGVGTPGSWVGRLERMQNCNSTWLNGKPLLADLNRSLAGRVRIANDADCFTLSETHGGSAAGRSVVFGVILGTGVGGGLVVDGRLHSGANGLAGEWGHTPLVQTAPGMPSRLCYCGRLNCVETFLSGPGLLASHQQLWPEERERADSAEAVYTQAAIRQAEVGWQNGASARERSESHVTRARATLSIYCEMLAANLARIVNTLDPHVIVLGGGLSQMTAIYPVVRGLMAEHVFGEVFETELVPPRFGASSGVRGAAWLWDASDD